MPGLETQQPWTAMKVHQWTVKASFNEQSFQVIEEYGSIRPSVSSFSSPQCFPLLSQIIVTIKNILLGVFAKEHLTDDGFNTPKTTALIQINTIESTCVPLDGLQ
jgi:hypothetical protein